MYIIQASTLTKIFLPEWHDRCLQDPKIALKSEPFKIHIHRPVGSIVLTHNVPVLASSLIGKTKERKTSDDEVSPLVEWLTNEQNAETDQWGVVAISIENNMADAIMALVYEEDGAERQKKLITELKKKLAKDVVSARERADARVFRQCSKMYNIVRETWASMKKDGKGTYSPSYSEALALDILKDQIKLRRVPDEKATGIFEKAMEEMAPGAM